MDPLLILLIVVLPGFLCVVIIRELILAEGQPIQFELIVWSGFFSFFIYTIIYTVIRIFKPGSKNINELINSNQEISNLIIVALFAFILALIIGLSVSYAMVKYKLVNKIFKAIHLREIIDDTVWERVINSSLGPVIVHTVDDNQYYGQISNYSKKKEKYELYIVGPSILKEDGFEELLGIDGILFFQTDIKRIEFLE